MTANIKSIKMGNWFNLFVAMFACLLFRLIPFRAPNVEPILTATMPFGKAYGRFMGFFFAFFSVIAYDLITGTVGKWTILTSITYGLIGVASAYYFKTREGTGMNFARFAVVSTLFFDATTGLLTGPLFFDQSFYAALVGQVPFTVLHLIGNVSFAFLLSPILYKILYRKKVDKEVYDIKILNPKTI